MTDGDDFRSERILRAALASPPTEKQAKSVRQFYGDDAPQHLTLERASALLSVRNYLQAVAYHVFEKRGVYVTDNQVKITALEVLHYPNLVGFIVQ